MQKSLLNFNKFISRHILHILYYRCQIIFRSEYFKKLVEINSLEHPLNTKIGLIRGLVSVGVCIQEKAIQKQYMDEILQPIANNYQQMLAVPNFTEVYQNENVKICVRRSLEEMKAAFKGTTLRSAQYVFNIFKDILFEIYKLMELYHNYPVRS